jgi:quercetin dioxygenase-like cupin family protein
MRMPDGDAITQAFEKVRGPSGASIEVGTARLRVGERVPLEGESRHAGIEISYVLSGVVDVVNESGTQRISQGDLVIVPRNEWHYSHAIEEATLIYAFFEDPA